ncbi:MAG: hypothetical protein Q8R60_05845 [Mycobacteriales bacterium]|jgi:ATP synthase protein I|nr:hypothetical protein [Mycobacteriales bacterium]
MSHDGSPGGQTNPGDAWTVIAYILSGLLLWGGVGLLVDRWLGTDFVVGIGMLLGCVSSLYLVYIRYGRETP